MYIYIYILDLPAKSEAKVFEEFATEKLARPWAKEGPFFSLCDSGEMDSLIIPAVNVSQLQWTVYLFCDGECRYGVQILAMSHEPCIFVEYIEWGAPNHPSVSFPSLPKKCGRYAASPRRTPPEEAPVPEESKANIQNERLGEVLPTWLALS